MQIEQQDAIRAAVSAFVKSGVDYFLFGANAHNVWGDPRFTTDADFIVVTTDEMLSALVNSLHQNGFKIEFERDHQRIKSARMLKSVYDRVSVDFVLGETEFDRNALQRRKEVTYLDIRLNVASPEDVILYKLVAHRPRDIADIENIIRRQRAVLDRAYLRKWASWLSRNTGIRKIETTLRSMLKQFGKRRK